MNDIVCLPSAEYPICFEEYLTRRGIQPQPRSRWNRRDTTGCFAAPAARKEA